MVFLNLNVLLQIPKEIAIQYSDVYHWICVKLYNANEVKRDLFWEYYFFITNERSPIVIALSQDYYGQMKTIIPKVKLTKLYNLMCKVYQTLRSEEKDKLYYSTMNILLMERKRRKKQTNKMCQQRFEELLTRYNLLGDLDNCVS